RLIAAQSGDELASYSESAKDAGDLIPSVDRLTKELRGKIGESLKTVRAAPPLDQVTTASLGALKSYAAGMEANDVRGNYPMAIQDFRDAIAQDSTFAMAYVQLAYSLLSQPRSSSRAQAQAALSTAFHLRERLPERERYDVEGGYYMNVAPDRRKAIAALRHAVELDSTNYDAANSLAVTFSETRDYTDAERMYHLALANSPSNGTLLTNLAILYTAMGRHASFDSVMAVMASRGVPFPTVGPRYAELWTSTTTMPPTKSRERTPTPAPTRNTQSLTSPNYADGCVKPSSCTITQTRQTSACTPIPPVPTSPPTATRSWMPRYEVIRRAALRHWTLRYTERRWPRSRRLALRTSIGWRQGTQWLVRRPRHVR